MRITSLSVGGSTVWITSLSVGGSTVRITSLSVGGVGWGDIRGEFREDTNGRRNGTGRGDGFGVDTGQAEVTALGWTRDRQR